MFFWNPHLPKAAKLLNSSAFAQPFGPTAVLILAPQKGWAAFDSFDAFRGFARRSKSFWVVGHS